MRIINIKYRTIITVLLVLLMISILIVFTMFKGKVKETFFREEDVYYKGNIEKKTIAFTCNVDWGNDELPLMLEIFERENIKITFFVTGTWAKKNPELLKKLYNSGHEIGSHGYFHEDYSKLSYVENRNEILKADKIITDIINYKPVYFAPPSGAYNNDTLKAASDLNYKVIMWSVDTIDWRKDSNKNKIIQRVIGKASNSDIVLMHPKKETIKALPIIINELKSKGFKIGKISDVIT